MLKAALQILLAVAIAIPQAFAGPGPGRDLGLMTREFVRTGNQAYELIEATFQAEGSKNENVERMIWTLLDADVSNAQKAVRLTELQTALEVYAQMTQKERSSSLVYGGTLLGAIVMMFGPILLQDPNAQYGSDHITAAFEGVGRGFQFILGTVMGAAVGSLLGQAADSYLKFRLRTSGADYLASAKVRFSEECQKLLSAH